MLSLFPEILFLAPVSALALRITLTVILARTAWMHVSESAMLPRAWALLEIALAVALLAGAWTQLVAFVAAVWLFASIFVPQMRVFPTSTVVLAMIMALSLVVTGAGAFAFDLPL